MGLSIKTPINKELKMNTNYKQVITYLKNFYHNHIRYSCHYTTIEKIGIRQDIDYVIEIIQKRMQGDNE